MDASTEATAAPAVPKRKWGKKRKAQDEADALEAAQALEAAAAKLNQPKVKAVKPVSNWEKLKHKIEADTEVEEAITAHKKKRRRKELSSAIEHVVDEATKKANKKPVFDINKDDDSHVDKSKYVALDCEMVGMGADGKKSALARCAIVDYDGIIIYDEYVRPQGFVTDFRTQYSGIRKKDLRYGTAITLSECQQQVDAIIKGKILVGHALKNDLDVLMLKHPRHSIRDTATFKPYMRPHGRKGGKFKPRSLKDLTRQFLGYAIQTGEHDPGEDSRAPMMLYRFKRIEWERSLAMAGKKKKEGGSAKKKPVDEKKKSVDETAAPRTTGLGKPMADKVSAMFKS
jgi:RNA exonuclease 4